MGYEADLEVRHGHKLFFGKSIDEVQSYFAGGRSIERAGFATGESPLGVGKPDLVPDAAHERREQLALALRHLFPAMTRSLRRVLHLCQANDRLDHEPDGRDPALGRLTVGETEPRDASLHSANEAPQVGRLHPPGPPVCVPREASSALRAGNLGGRRQRR